MRNVFLGEPPGVVELTTRKIGFLTMISNVCCSVQASERNLYFQATRELSCVAAATTAN
jgi:hypothetical protein